MEENSSIGTQTTFINIEISKVCWIVDKNDIESIKSVVKNNYLNFGGVNHLIIPVFNDQIDTFFENCINLYQPDYYVTTIELNKNLENKLRNLSVPIQIIKYDEYLNQSIKLIDTINKRSDISYHGQLLFFDYDKLNSFEQDFVNIIYPIDLINKISSYLNLQISKKFDNINDFIKSTNMYSELNVKIQKSYSIYSSRFEKKEIQEVDYINKEIQEIEKETDNKSTKTSKFLNRASSIFNDSVNIIIGNAKSSEDICTFWNLKTLSTGSSNTFWIPMQSIDSENIFTYISDVLVNKKELSTININIYSHTIDNNKLKNISNNLKLKLAKNITIIINPRMPADYITLALVLKSYQETIIFNKKRGIIIPQFPDYLDKQSIMSDIIINIGLEDYNFAINNDVVELICNEKCKMFNSSLRVRNEYKNAIEIKEPDGIEIIKSALNNRGFDIGLSDKGIIGMKIINLLENIDECSIFEQNELIKMIKYLSNEKTETESLDKIKSFFNDEDKDKKIQLLLDRKILFRGFVLKCKDCSTTNWIPIERVEEDNICSGCLSSIKLPLNAEFSFRLNSLIKNGYKLGVITHITTILKLSKRVGTKLFIPGVFIKNLNREIDIIMLNSSGYLIGECKNDGTELNNAEADSIVQLSSALNATKVVFGSLEKNFTIAIKNKYNLNENIIFIEKN